MATTAQMLEALHKADPRTLSKRYTPQQLQAAFAKLGGGAAPATPGAPTPHDLRANFNQINGPGAAANATPHQLRAAFNQINGPGAAAGQAAPAAPLPGDPTTPAVPATVPVGTPTNPAGPAIPGTATTPAEAQANIATSAGNVVSGQVDSGFYDQPFQFEADDAARQRVEDAAFARLTRGVDDMEGRDRQANAQTLADKGIPYSDDPNSRYQMELRDLNNRYDTIRGNARQDAVAAGGQELERQFQIQSGAYNTALGGTDMLSKLGLAGNIAFEQLSAQEKENALNRAFEKWKTKYVVKNANKGGGGGGTSDNGFGLNDPGGGSTGGL